VRRISIVDPRGDLAGMVAVDVVVVLLRKDLIQEQLDFVFA
jgi:hypothetical protein